MSTETIIVTGATDGIGKETARALLRLGHSVIVHGRTEAKARVVASELASAQGQDPARARGVYPVWGNLASLAEVRSLAAMLRALSPAPTILVNNAGVYMRAYQASADGFEMTLAVNHLAPFLLTHELITSDRGSLHRIVNVSSVAHMRGKLDVDDLGFERRGFDGYATYAASKLCNVLYSAELARRTAGRLTVFSLHPGVVSTKLLTEGFQMQGPDSLEKGAETTVYLATTTNPGAPSGSYFADKKPARAHSAIGNRELCRRLFDRTAELVSVTAMAESGP